MRRRFVRIWFYLSMLSIFPLVEYDVQFIHSHLQKTLIHIIVYMYILHVPNRSIPLCQFFKVNISSFC